VTHDDRALFDQAPCGYAVVDATGLLTDVNLEGLRLLARDRDEVVDRLTLPDVLSKGGQIYCDTHIFPMLRLQGAVREVALDLVQPDGTRVPVLVNANLVGGGAARSWARLVLLEARDRHRYEADLRDATRTAQEARRAAVELAEALQQTLIPPAPPRIAGLDLAAAYRPAGDGSEVGGDFYDVFQVGPDEWMVVIGDVLGKGVRAGLVTTFVRHTVRDLAMQVVDPAELLHRLDRAILQNPTERFCTLVVLRLTRDSEGWEMTGSVGGHPLPLLRQRSGLVVELGVPGSLVGILSSPTFTTFRHRLTDELVVLCTDGVVEGRRGLEEYGHQRLAALVASSSSVEAVTESVVTSVLDFQGGVARDDIAVVALAVSDES
jgi:sigma-B regulation protein RsbU (phosphoserine phosphatase)